MHVYGVFATSRPVAGFIRHGVDHARRVTLLTGIAAVMCAMGLAASPCRGEENDTVRVQSAIDQYTAAMECKDRTQRLRSFARAEQLFRQLVEGDAGEPGVHNANLYVNLGNAALQAERIGPAIVAYRYALELAPHHRQARQNLTYARTLLPDWIRLEETHGLIDSLFFWRSLLTPGQIQIYCAVCFLAAAVLVGIGIGRNQPLLRNLAIMPLLAWLAIGISLFLEPDTSALRNVVVVEESVVYAADSENSLPRLSKPLPSGAELTLVQVRDRWTEVQLPDGRTGWVLSSAIERLEPIG